MLAYLHNSLGMKGVGIESGSMIVLGYCTVINLSSCTISSTFAAILEFLSCAASVPHGQTRKDLLLVVVSLDIDPYLHLYCWICI